MTNVERALGFLGLLARGGQVTSGEEGALTMVRSGKAGIVLLDEDTGATTRKRFVDACAFRSVPLIDIASGELGRAIGKPMRKVAAVQTGAAASKIKDAFTNGNMEKRGNRL